MAKLKVSLSLAFTVYPGICPLWLQNPPVLHCSPYILYTDTEREVGTMRTLKAGGKA